MLHNNVQQNKMIFFQDVYHNERAQDQDPLVGWDYNRPNIIKAKQTELEKFWKFNVIETVPRATWGAEIMRTTWVVTEKMDHLSNTGSKVKSRLCIMGNSSEEYSKDSLSLPHVGGT